MTIQRGGFAAPFYRIKPNSRDVVAGGLGGKSSTVENGHSCARTDGCFKPQSRSFKQVRATPKSELASGKCWMLKPGAKRTFMISTMLISACFDQHLIEINLERMDDGGLIAIVLRESDW